MPHVNSETRKKYHREYYRGYMRKWRAEHPGHVARLARARRAADPTKHRLAGRKAHYKKKFGLSLEMFDLMFETQGKCCKICRTDQSKGRGWVVDHCHKTGQIRGILCHKCNTSLGGFGDNINTIRAALTYLE